MMIAILNMTTLLNENILNSLLPSEGGQINGKDWIEELHETNV